MHAEILLAFLLVLERAGFEEDGIGAESLAAHLVDAAPRWSGGRIRRLRVLWKFNGELPATAATQLGDHLGSDIRVEAGWVAQNDVLGHPKVELLGIAVYAWLVSDYVS